MLQRILSTYFDRWKFRHPQPADFFAVVDEVSGQDMTWFFDQVHRGSNTFVYGVQRFTSTQVRPVRGADTDEVPAATLYRTLVVVQRLGEAVFPVDVVTTLRDGERITDAGTDATVVPSTPTNDRRRHCRCRWTRACATARRGLYKQQRTLEPRAGEAGLKWSLMWLAWLQDLMLTYAFLCRGVERSGD